MSQSPAIKEAAHDFNKYRLREPLSESFLGTRYRAVSNANSLRAASNAFGSDISALRSSAFALRLLRAPGASLIDRVARAAKAVRYLDHPNVLAPIQLIRAQTRLGIITQDIDGFTLSDLLRLASSRGEALPQNVALRIALDILDGIAALHETEPDTQRYQHACGGITPDSIHVGKDGRARLIDPGVAGAAASVAFWGHDPVALAYTAPEQTGAEPSFTPCSDAFSVGVMLWEMLAGRSLFGAPTAAETLEHLHKRDIVRVQRHHFVRGEPIAATVAHVVAQSLQRDPAHRHQNCVELAVHLRESAAIASHADVAEHCHRLGISSAGAFDDLPRTRGVASASAFELPSGAVSLSVPPSSVKRLPIAPPASEPPAEPFVEPLTAKITPIDALQYAPTPQPLPVGPITAFPISDFVPIQPVSRKNYVPIAVAAAALIGLSLVAYSATSSSTPASAPGRELPTAASAVAASRPVAAEPARAAAVAVPAAPSVSPPLAPLTTQMTSAPSAPTTVPIVTVDPTAPAPPPIAASDQPLLSATPEVKRTETWRRRTGKDKTDKVEPKRSTPSPSSAPSGTFIPEDL